MSPINRFSTSTGLESQEKSLKLEQKFKAPLAKDQEETIHARVAPIDFPKKDQIEDIDHSILAQQINSKKIQLDTVGKTGRELRGNIKKIVPYLTYLDMSHLTVFFPDNKELSDLLESAKKVDTFKFWIWKRDPFSLPDHFSNLKMLTAESPINFPKKMPYLELLSVVCWSQFKYQNPSTYPESLPNLRILKFTLAEPIFDFDTTTREKSYKNFVLLLSKLPHMPKLEKLVIPVCFRAYDLTDALSSDLVEKIEKKQITIIYEKNR